MEAYNHKYKVLILYLLCISAFFASLNQNIYTPIIPLIRDSFEVSLNWVNFSVGSFIFITAIMQIALGSVIDYKSQKNSIVIGLVVTSIATFICIFATNFITFLFFRIIQAIGTAIIPLISINMIAKLFEDGDRGSAMGTYQILLSLAPAVAPVLGGFIGEVFGYKGIFTFLSLISISLLLLNIFVLPEDNHAQNKESKPKTFTQRYIDILSNGKGIHFGILVYLPVLLTNHYHVSLQIVGLLYLPLTLSIIIGSFFYKFVQKKIKLQTLFNAVAFLMPALVISFGIVHDQTIIGLTVILFIYGITVGFAPPLFSTIISNTYTENRGAALGLFNFVRYSGMALGSMISGLYTVMNLGFLFIFMGIILYVISIICLLYSKSSTIPGN